MVCIACHQPTATMWLCNTCKMPYERAYAVGERSGILQRLIGLYKFERARDAYVSLAKLLLDILPHLPEDTIIVPVPTVAGHIRERGYDHMLLIAQYIAKNRGLECCSVIERKTNTKQRQATARQRISQAKQAFVVNRVINKDAPYLLIDDVVTTGATVRYAAKALRDAGAKHIWVAVIARQVMDK